MADFRELERDVPVEGDTAKNTELSTSQSLKTQFTAENCEVFTQPGLRPAFNYSPVKESGGDPPPPHVVVLGSDSDLKNSNCQPPGQTSERHIPRLQLQSLSRWG